MPPVKFITEVPMNTTQTRPATESKSYQFLDEKGRAELELAINEFHAQNAEMREQDEANEDHQD